MGITGPVTRSVTHPFTGRFLRRVADSWKLLEDVENVKVYLGDGSELYELSDGTTEATDSDPVGYWEDLSGEGHHGTQDTTSAKPTLNGGLVEFDGLDDYLDTGLVIDTSQPYGLFIGVDWHDQSGSGSSVFPAASHDGNRVYIVYKDGDNNFRFGAGDTFYTDMSGLESYSPGKWRFGVVADGTEATAYIDGEAKDTISYSGSPSSAPLYVGARNDGTSAGDFFDGGVYVLIGVQGSLSSGDISQIDDLMADIMGQ